MFVGGDCMLCMVLEVIVRGFECAALGWTASRSRCILLLDSRSRCRISPKAKIPLKQNCFFSLSHAFGYPMNHFTLASAAFPYQERTPCPRKKYTVLRNADPLGPLPISLSRSSLLIALRSAMARFGRVETAQMTSPSTLSTRYFFTE